MAGGLPSSVSRPVRLRGHAAERRRDRIEQEARGLHGAQLSALTGPVHRSRTGSNEGAVNKPPQIRDWAAAVAVLGCVLAVCGCGSTVPATTKPATAATPAHSATPEPSAALPAALRGSWKRTMKARDWRSAGSGYPVGTWRFDVNRRGSVAVYLPGTDVVDFTMPVTVKGHQLTIETIPVCPGQSARYSWRASAK